jgi:aminopeptidase
MIVDRFHYADSDTLDYSPEWLYHQLAKVYETGAARLWIAGPYPNLLSGIEVRKILQVHNAISKASKPEADLISASRINWHMLPFVTASWAAQVFPRRPSQEAIRVLWEHVFDFTRVNSPDPILSWQEHERTLEARREFLQMRKFDALHFYDGRTDLRVGLAKGHRWVGGKEISASGIQFCCKFPMEEIYTCPQRDRVDGSVFFSRPLVLAGTLVRDLKVEFCDGLAVSVKAQEGQETFETLLGCDEDGRRIGEIGLVPHSSPIAQSRVLFYNALFEENSATHLAFGQASENCLDTRAGDAATNHNSIRIDCMFGNAQMNVDGLSGSGHSEPVMRGGEFLFP